MTKPDIPTTPEDEAEIDELILSLEMVGIPMELPWEKREEIYHRSQQAKKERKDSLVKWILWQEMLDKIRPKGWTEYLMQIPVSPKKPNRLPSL